MIKSLDIRNYALIDALRVEYAAGLTIITGETGAGKSIILGGLGLIMGQRADTKALYDERKKCVIEAEFLIGAYKLEKFFEEQELDYDEHLFIRREILPSGKTRAFVNDTPVKLSVLQDLTRSLVDLHQQFDTLDIHNVSFQLRMLDALADNKKLLRAYEQDYHRFRADERELKRLHAERDRLRQEADFVAFQLQEFTDLGLVAGESETLEQELKTLGAAEDIKRSLGAAGVQLVEDEQSVVSQVRGLMPRVEALRGINRAIDELADRLEAAAYELEDLGQQYVSIAEDTEFDEDRINEVQQRLSAIYKLQQKHGVASEEELLEVREGYLTRAKSTKDVDRGVARLEESIATQRKVLIERALELRTRREGVVQDFQKRIQKRLSKLSMVNARIEIDFTPLDEPGVTGMDEVVYLFSANKGSRMLPIKDVASGGEISRLTLVTKSLVAASIPLPTLIFDEIDSGVSGDVALRMGEILHELAEKHQVIVITHSPQVASKADRHYFVYKQEAAERTVTRIRELDRGDRVRVLAIMLSSDPPSKPAIANAQHLLK